VAYYCREHAKISTPSSNTTSKKGTQFIHPQQNTFDYGSDPEITDRFHSPMSQELLQSTLLLESTLPQANKVLQCANLSNCHFLDRICNIWDRIRNIGSDTQHGIRSATSWIDSKLQWIGSTCGDRICSLWIDSNLQYNPSKLTCNRTLPSKAPTTSTRFVLGHQQPTSDSFQAPSRSIVAGFFKFSGQGTSSSSAHQQQ